MPSSAHHAATPVTATQRPPVALSDAVADDGAPAHTHPAQRLARPKSEPDLGQTLSIRAPPIVPSPSCAASGVSPCRHRHHSCARTMHAHLLIFAPASHNASQASDPGPPQRPRGARPARRAATLKSLFGPVSWPRGLSRPERCATRALPRVAPGPCARRSPASGCLPADPSGDGGAASLSLGSPRHTSNVGARRTHARRGPRLLAHRCAPEAHLTSCPTSAPAKCPAAKASPASSPGPAPAPEVASTHAQILPS